jgi:hypothetical protein
MKWLAPALAAVGVLVALAAPALMGSDPKGADASLVALVPWGAVAAVLVGVVAARSRPEVGLAPGLASLVSGAASLVAIGMAVGAERQNYWDAWHFASLFWAGAAGSVLGVVALARARRQSTAAAVGLPVSLLLVAVYLILWSWMTFSFVQDIEGAVARWAYLLTHG